MPDKPVQPLNAEVHGDYLVKIISALDAIRQELDSLRGDVAAIRKQTAPDQ